MNARGLNSARQQSCGLALTGITPPHHHIAAATMPAKKPGNRDSTTPFSNAATSAVLAMATVVDVSILAARKTLIATATKVSVDRAGRLARTLPRRVSRKGLGDSVAVPPSFSAVATVGAVRCAGCGLRSRIVTAITIRAAAVTTGENDGRAVSPASTRLPGFFTMTRPIDPAEHVSQGPRDATRCFEPAERPTPADLMGKPSTQVCLPE